MNRQRLILFLLLISLAGAVVWAYYAMPRQKTVAKLTYTPGQQPKTEASRRTVESQDQRILRLDLLDQAKSGFKGYRRNIFKPVFEDEIKNMKQKAAAIKPLELPPQSKAAPPPLPDTPQRELARFTFLGFLKKDSKRTIFLEKDKEIFLVKAGDNFGSKFEATTITEQALTILVKDSGEEIVIPLLESQPLTAGK